jgi:hypothetical protein
VHVRGVDARAGELPRLVAVGEQVGDVRGAVQVAALDQHPPGAEVVQCDRGPVRGVAVGDRHPHEQPDLVQVRGDEGRAGEEQGADGVHGVVGQERLAVHRRGDGVDEERHPVVVAADPHLVDDLGDGLDDPRRREHPGLGGADPDVADDRPDLRRDDVRRHQVHVGDPERVLHRHGRHRDAAVHPAHRHRPQVGLEAGGAPGVGAGDRQRAGRRLAHGSHAPMCTVVVAGAAMSVHMGMALTGPWPAPSG